MTSDQHNKDCYSNLAKKANGIQESLLFFEYTSYGIKDSCRRNNYFSTTSSNTKERKTVRVGFPYKHTVRTKSYLMHSGTLWLRTNQTEKFTHEYRVSTNITRLKFSRINAMQSSALLYLGHKNFSKRS